MEEYKIHTDLACESEVTHDSGKGGTSYSEEEKDGFTVAKLSVENDEGAKNSGKPIGRYVTVFSDLICDVDGESLSALGAVISNEISALMESLGVKNSSCVLVAGLGNREITADNIGPKTVDRLTVTRHLMLHNKELFDSYWRAPLCAIAPGVLGQTGIETAEILSGICSRAKPELVIVIDALAARSTERLGSTVQISDSGIFPGSGIGNRRSEISKRTLGVPVIAIGVPTVVNSSTLVYDALKNAGYETLDENLLAVLREGESFFVSPKQSDRISESVSELLALAVDKLFFKEG